MKKIVILGSGGNCIDILDTINEINSISKKYDCIGFLDDNPDQIGKEFYGVRVIGSLDSAVDFADAVFVNGIGSSLNFWKKKSIIQKTMIPLERFETIIHPSASVSSFSHIGIGTVIFQNVTITSNVRIGNHVIILPNSVISHDDVIGDYTCITGGVCISGGVTIGESCYLGTNCSIIGNIKIGNNCLIGMGSNVLRDVDDNSVVMGNPAKYKRKTIE
ncbi:MAG TPA: acetyltransferase [Saprospiraceae bacterium]|nr:acetyltransferase [Saprospiraceae bacterium]